MTQMMGEIYLLHAHICRVLGHPKRILLLYALAKGPRHITDLAEE